MTVDERLKEWATPRQIEFINAVNTHGSIRAAARALKVNKNNITQALHQIQARAATRGYSPKHSMTKTVPDGFGVKRISSNYNSKGELNQQWVIASPEAEQQLKMMKAVVDAMSQEVSPFSPSPPCDTITDPELCNVYTVTDYHMGMAATRAEGSSSDWDLKIAEDLLVAVFENLIARAPASRVAILNQLGDFLHYDSLDPVTPTSKHVLDASSRFEPMIWAAVRVLRRIVGMLLVKHEEVHLVLAEGNHDLTAAPWLRVVFGIAFENDPRVTVNHNNTLPYHAYTHGKVFLGFHHGHKRTKENLPLLFAAMFREDFGRTKVGYIHTGHQHHVDEKEYPGFKVIQHPTLAPPDSYALRGGWMSEREACVITYHSAGYQVGRTFVTPEMIGC